MDTRDAELAGASSSSALDEETLWRMNLRESESMESGPYPERPAEPDCAYYIRTGLCRFGITCRYNHPPNRKLAIAAARMKGGYPERVGQPECQYYLKTGMCKFGATCKFHHPRDKAGIAGRVQLNILGYPLRPNEKECAYYLRTGQCKFGNTCKFHHPQPSNAMVAVRGSAVYTPVQSATTPGQQSYPGGLTNWPLSRAFIQSPRWQGPSSYTPMMLPQGLVHVPSWNTFPGQLGSVSSPGSPQQNPGTAQYYGSSQQSEPSSGAQGSFYGALQRENVFPDRPDEPECQFYMKTGDCKFGAVCRFHHPRERLIPVPNCVLSPLGLPLRPGQPLCIFYSRYGICKFGPNCKFDHPMATPMGIFAYNLSTSSVDVPVVRRLLGSPSGPPMLALSSQGSAEAGSRRPRGLSLSVTESRQLGTGDENIEVEGSRGATVGSGGQVSSFS